MRDAQKEVYSLREFNPQATLVTDGAVTCVLLPGTPFVTAAGTEVMDAVLCPQGLGGYVTRLLLERRIVAKTALNWQVVTLLGRLWHTFSWNHVSPEQCWTQIFAEHGRALR